jgi:hypothetical protein
VPRFLKLLADNYTWLFSGVGVALLVGVVAWLVRRKGKSDHGSSVSTSKSKISGSVVAGQDNIIQTINIPPSHDPTDDEYSETPTADEVMAQTSSLPFLWQASNPDGLRCLAPCPVRAHSRLARPCPKSFVSTRRYRRVTAGAAGSSSVVPAIPSKNIWQ